MSVHSTSSSTTVPESRVGTWAAVGFVLYVALGIGTLFAVAVGVDLLSVPLGIDVGAGTIGLSLRNGAYYIVWGFAAALAALPIGRRLLPAARFGGWQATLVLAAGAFLAGVTEFQLNEWARERFVYFDPEYVGLAGFAPAATLAVALSTWAARSVPREPRRSLLMLVAAAILGFALCVLPSVPGALDGIEPESVALAAILVVDGVFAAAALVIARR